MAPWDEFEYFFLPQVSYMHPTNSGTFQLVDGNPNRICLVFGNAGAIPGFIGVDPAMASDGSQGYPLINTVQPLTFDQRSYGIMVQVPWFLAGGAAGVGPMVTVTEIILNRWPKMTKAKA